tara:strand:- start:2403 stop:3455 length:1053 start_codon:yes stop_codon:yes gene_type:complete
MANYNTFGPDDIIPHETTKVVTSTWTNNVNALTASFTSSNPSTTSPTSSGAFFMDVYNDATTSSIQYSVAYGHKKGSGSLLFNASAKGYSPTSVIYNQYRQLVYGDNSTNFSFNGYTPDDIYVININRARYKHNLKPGVLNLTLASGSGGNHFVLNLTDDSITTTGSATIRNVGREFNLVSGSSGVQSGSNLTQVESSGSYGLYYPDSGFIILNPAALSTGDALSSSLTTVSESLVPIVTSNAASNNHHRLINTLNHESSSFIVDSEEKVSAQYYFARIKNKDFNYTTNPTFRDSSGNLLYSDMESNPKVYITTVGLYDNSNNLLAVAKLSQPIAKEFSKEALIRIKLDY